MKTLNLKKFRSPNPRSDPDTDDRNGIWVVRRADKKCEKLILFVHGLGGDPVDTWGQFPEIAFNELRDFDVGFYGYSSPNLSNLIPLVRKPRLSAYAKQMRRAIWVSLIREAGFQEIAYVCHSLGGVIVKAMVHQIEERDDNRDDLFTALHSVFFFGTPHFGSDRIRRFTPTFFSPLLSALRLNSKELAPVRDFWQDRVSFDPLDKRARRMLIHARAIYSDKDFWVDADSARARPELDDGKTYPFPVAHSRLVKPVSKDEGHILYFFDELRSIDEMRNNGDKFVP